MIRFLYVATIAAATHDVRRRIREEGNNRGDAVTHMLRNADINVAAPWCAAAVQDWSDTGAQSLGIENPLDAVKHEALVASYAVWAERSPYCRIVTYPPQAIPGDLVLYNFGGDRWDHIGLLVRPPSADTAGSDFETIEGNTDADGAREGHGVYRKVRHVIPARQMFVRWV